MILTNFKYLEGNYNDSYFLYETSPDEVNRIIGKLECKYSCGNNEIRSKVIKYAATYVSVPLSHIFNLTFATGKIPNGFKVALKAPVYKASEKMYFRIIDPSLYCHFFFQNTRKANV